MQIAGALAKSRVDEVHSYSPSHGRGRQDRVGSRIRLISWLCEMRVHHRRPYIGLPWPNPVAHLFVSTEGTTVLTMGLVVADLSALVIYVCVS